MARAYFPVTTRQCVANIHRFRNCPNLYRFWVNVFKTKKEKDGWED